MGRVGNLRWKIGFYSPKHKHHAIDQAQWHTAQTTKSVHPHADRCKIETVTQSFTSIITSSPWYSPINKRKIQQWRYTIKQCRIYCTHNCLLRVNPGRATSSRNSSEHCRIATEYLSMMNLECNQLGVSVSHLRQSESAPNDRSILVLGRVMQQEFPGPLSGRATKMRHFCHWCSDPAALQR